MISILGGNLLQPRVAGKIFLGLFEYAKRSERLSFGDQTRDLWDRLFPRPLPSGSAMKEPCSSRDCKKKGNYSREGDHPGPALCRRIVRSRGGSTQEIRGFANHFGR